MKRLILYAWTALLLAALPPPVANAQQLPPPASEAGRVEQSVAPEAPVGGLASLPAQPAPPRTLRAYWHVFVAFALVWLLLFGYALLLGRRFGRLEREIRRLGGEARDG